MPCNAISVTAGQIGAGQTASSLTNAELTGTTDVWADYVELSPSTRIVCSYTLPSGTTAGTVSSLALQVNYRGASQARQVWTFEVLDNTTGAWTLLGDNSFASGWVWSAHTFTVPAPLTRFFTGTTLQIRYGTTSSLDASDIDQLLVTGTR
jgi:cysteinyl-tRNA synthetase